MLKKDNRNEELRSIFLDYANSIIIYQIEHTLCKNEEIHKDTHKKML